MVLIFEYPEFTLCTELNHQLISDELVTFYDHTKTAIIDGTSSSKALFNKITSIQSDELKADEVQAAWEMVANIDTNVQLQNADGRILAALSLTVDSNMWSWFNTNVTEPTRYLADLPIHNLKPEGLPTLPNQWILRMVTAVRCSLIANLPVKLLAKDYLGLDAPDYETISASRRADPASVLRHVESAVTLWLDFRAKRGTRLETSRAVATFVSIARAAFGSPNFLYLTHIQNGLKKLRSTLTKERIPLDRVPWKQLAEELKTHPLADPNSKESSTLKYLVNLLQVVSGFSQPPEIQVDFKKVIGAGEEGLNIFTSSLAQSHQEIILHHEMESPRHSPTPQPSPPSPDPERFSTFIAFLKAAFWVVQEDKNPMTLTQERIAKNRDYFLPFRQLGPSKQIILNDPDGPFSPAKLKTREGFFDAIIFRLITQASPFLLAEKQVCFGSLHSFQETTKGKVQESYCNPTATGQHIRFHNIPHIPAYWENSADWGDYVSGPGITFDSLRTWLTGKKGSKTRFYGMGNLVGWLLATDYAYAGLVTMPDVSEVGRIIYDIDAGGKGGLKLLGFDVGTKEACAEAMECVWAKVQEHLTSAELSQMGLEPITLEHALCKFSRLYKKCIAKVSSNFHYPPQNLDLTSFLIQSRTTISRYPINWLGHIHI
jgi:hypothetical protein